MGAQASSPAKGNEEQEHCMLTISVHEPPTCRQTGSTAAADQNEA